MSLRQFCANTACPKHTEYSGGRFIWSAEAKAFFCEDCHRIKPVMNDGQSVSRWEFTTTHFNGKAIRVKGLNHLRQLEKEFGVSNVAANNNSNNWGPPAPIPTPGYGDVGIHGGRGQYRG